MRCVRDHYSLCKHMSSPHKPTVPAMLNLCYQRRDRPTAVRQKQTRHPHKWWWVSATGAALLLSACAGAGQNTVPQGAQSLIPQVQAGKLPPKAASAWQPGPDWELSWTSSFEGADPLSDWNIDTEGNGWGNRQLQYYSARNVVVQPGGGVALTATTDGYGEQCWYGACEYSSGRLETKGLFQQEYGIFSAYIKLPAGPGLWPAFWMEGIDDSTVTWPYGGEIDVIEVNNQKPDLVEAFVHAPQVNRGFYHPLANSLSASYHVYSVEWTPEGITWLIDGHEYGHTQTPVGAAPFNQPFYLILDLAVGGIWPGSPTSATKFPAQMDIAWVRVYKQKPAA